MHTIRPDWMKLKLIIRFSVLRTVLKLRFSRVRKYFWLRVMVDSWPEILKADSDSALVCSTELPCFDGRATRASFSTCYGSGGRQNVRERICPGRKKENHTE